MKTTHLLPAAFLAAALWSQALSAASPPLTVYFPNPFHDSPAHREALKRIEAYSRESGVRVELVRKGADFSALKEAIAARIAGVAPDLALIEASEWPALESTGAVKKRLSVPFSRVVPVIVVDQEFLFRMRERTDPRARHLSDWLSLAQRASRFLEAHRPNEPSHALALPLVGSRGLWFAEMLARKPLWTREPGGVRANRELEPDFEQLRALTEAPRGTASVRTDLSEDRALQEFLDRKLPMVALSSDALPIVADQARFRWKAYPLPGLRGEATPARGTGSDWVVLSTRPEAQAFINAISHKPPPRPPSFGLGELDPALRSSEFALRERSTDREILRLRATWIQALPALFGELSARKSVSEVLTQIDRQANAAASE